MLSCWQTVPESRPLFKILENTIGEMLDEGVRKKFIDLNEPYLYENARNSSTGNADDPSKMAVPKQMVRYGNFPHSPEHQSLLVGSATNRQYCDVNDKTSNLSNTTNASAQQYRNIPVSSAANGKDSNVYDDTSNLRNMTNSSEGMEMLEIKTDECVKKNEIFNIQLDQI